MKMLLMDEKCHKDKTREKKFTKNVIWGGAIFWRHFPGGILISTYYGKGAPFGRGGKEQKQLEYNDAQIRSAPLGSAWQPLS